MSSFLSILIQRLVICVFLDLSAMARSLMSTCAGAKQKGATPVKRCSHGPVGRHSLASFFHLTGHRPVATLKW